jgi:hypothetical protein
MFLVQLTGLLGLYHKKTKKQIEDKSGLNKGKNELDNLKKKSIIKVEQNKKKIEKAKLNLVRGIG